MTDDKLLHVSCIVRQVGIYDLLRALELHKVGNVEVRPVASMLALPAPNGQEGRRRKTGSKGNRWHAVVRTKVAAAMALKQKHRPADLAREIGENPKSVYSSLAALAKKGEIKKVGMYWMRIREQQQEAA